MPNDSAYADPDLLVAAALVGFLVAVLTAFLPAALRLVAYPGVLGGGLFTAGLIGRQRDGLHRALFVGLAPAAGLSFALLLDHPYQFRALEHYAAMGVTIGLLVGFFGYAAGTLEYWLSDRTPSPGRGDVARFVGVVILGAVLVVVVRVYAMRVKMGGVP